MSLNGNNIAQQKYKENFSQPVHNIDKMIQVNSIKQRGDNNRVSKLYRRVERESPVDLYTGIKLHASTQIISPIQTF